MTDFPTSKDDRVDNVDDAMADDINSLQDKVGIDDDPEPTSLDYILRTGWNPANGTWEYASATTITVPSGAALLYQKGDKFKLTANSVILQGYIVDVADELLTVVGDALTNHTFTLNFYSHASNPLGFPQWFDYTPSLANITFGNGTLDFSFCLTGRLATVHGFFAMGSTSSINSGGEGLTFSLPITARMNYSPESPFRANIRDAGVGFIPVEVHLSTTTTIIIKALIADSTNLRTVATNSTTPLTWAENDHVNFTFSYEI